MKTVEGVGLTWGGLETTKELNNDLSHDMSDMFAKRNYFCPAKSKKLFVQETMNGQENCFLIQDRKLSGENDDPPHNKRKRKLGVGGSSCKS